jgi:riboflavin synthase
LQKAKTINFCGFIPYTWEFTNMKNLKVGDKVNLEFDIIGKYIAKLLKK